MTTKQTILRVNMFSLARTQAVMALVGSLAYGTFLWLDAPRQYSALFTFVKLPFLSTLGGFFGGAATAALYNLAAWCVGGVEYDVGPSTSQSARDRYRKLAQDPINPPPETPPAEEPQS